MIIPISARDSFWTWPCKADNENLLINLFVVLFEFSLTLDICRAIPEDGVCAQECLKPIWSYRGEKTLPGMRVWLTIINCFVPATHDLHKHDTSRIVSGAAATCFQWWHFGIISWCICFFCKRQQEKLVTTWALHFWPRCLAGCDPSQNQLS